MAPSRSNYAVLPEPVLMEDRRSWNRGSNSGLWLMGVLSGLALLLTTALLVKTYVLNPHPVAHSHLGDGKVNKFDISQIQQIRPSPENDCYGDPSYWHEENFKYCCETAGTGPGCQSMHHNNDDLDRFDPESDNYQGFRGPGFDAPMFEGSYNPSYQSGSYDPTDSVGTICSDGYPPEIVSHEVIDEDGPFQKSDPYADFEQPDPKDFHPKEEFIDCTSPKDDDTIKKLEICCHHGNAGCDILAAKKAAKKAAEEKESEEKRKKKEKEQKEKEEREKKEKEQKEKEEREKKEKEEKEKEEQEKKEREEKEKKEREEKEKKEREEKEKKLKEEKEEEPKEEKEEKPKEEKEAKPKEEKEEKPKEKKEEKPKEEEEKPKEEKEEKPKEDKEEKPKEEKEEKPKEEKEEKPKEEKETKDTPKPATPEQPKKPAEEKNEESSKDKTEKPKTKASETKLKVKKAEEIGITTAIPATTLETSTTQHVAWYDKQNQVVWPTFNRLKLK